MLNRNHRAEYSRTDCRIVMMSLLTCALAFSGCASKSDTELTAVQKVERAKSSVNRTDAYIKDAQQNIQDLEKNLVSLRKDALSSNEMRGKDVFAQTLTSLTHKIGDAKQDLSKLKAANQDSYVEFKRSIDSARARMDDSFQDSIRAAE